MRSAITELFAVARSGRFTPYAQGVSVKLPTGDALTIKIEKVSKSLRPPGLRFSAFAFMTEVSAGGFQGVGFGEAPTRLIALQKSIAEGVERVLYKALKGTAFGSANSNGWAAHLSYEQALSAALDELVERDAVLVHWLGQIPMKEIAPASWPRRLTRWTQDELRLSPIFNQLRILISARGYKPTVTTVLGDHDGYAVLSHATAASLGQALDKALSETCRIAQIAMEQPQAVASSNIASPEDHALFYAFHERLPTWLFGDPIGWSAANSQWRAHEKQFCMPALEPKFHQIASGPLVVGFATSDQIQSLYFGRTEDAQEKGLINVRRMRVIKPEMDFYLEPHCVP